MEDQRLGSWRCSAQPHPSRPARFGLLSIAQVSPGTQLLKKDSRDPPAGKRASHLEFHSSLYTPPPDFGAALKSSAGLMSSSISILQMRKLRLREMGIVFSVDNPAREEVPSQGPPWMSRP
nr:uncharacterized protein LOC123285692 isoform X2 [Equus asinus]